MKSLTLAVIILLTLCLTVSGSAIIMNRQLYQMENDVIKCGEEKDDILAIYENYKAREWLFSICVADGLIYNLESAFTDWINSEDNEAKAAKSRLILEINHIRRLNGVNIKSIL